MILTNQIDIDSTIKYEKKNYVDQSTIFHIEFENISKEVKMIIKKSTFHK